MKTKNIFKLLSLLVLFVNVELLATGPRINPMLISPDKKEIFALDLPPFISTEVQNGGILNDIVTATFKEAKADAVITTLPLVNMLKYYLNEENALGVMGLHLGLSAKQEVAFIAIPLFVAQQSYIYYKPLHPNGISYKGKVSDFKGFIYGASKGEDVTLYDAAGVNIKKERTLSLFKKLKNGEVDFISVPKLSAEWFIDKHFAKNKNDFVMFENSDEAVVSLYFNTENKKANELALKFKKGLQTIVNNGQYKEILEKYIGDKSIVDKQLKSMHQFLK
jgi:polar amino acid transport system substrate-binding protein